MNLLSTVRCRLHIIAHMGVLDLRWESTLRIGEEPSPRGRAEPYLMALRARGRALHTVGEGVGERWRTRAGCLPSLGFR